jgi:DNA modification methylase
MKEGKERRLKVLQELEKYGIDLPTSILKAKELKGGYKSQKQWITEILKKRYEKKGVKDEGLLDFLLSSTSNISVRQTPLGTSRFPLNVARTLYWLYTEEGDLIADPFAGHGDRMEAAIQMNRRYVGWDLSKNMIQEIRQRLSEYPEEKQKLAKIIHGDSRLFELDEECDYVLTSPPYWCIEWYGDEPEQLGNCETYERFLIELKRIFKRVVKYLKPGKFITINVNDFRYKGKFYLYHVDVINILQDLGLEIHDIGIMQMSELPITHPFIVQYKERKYLMKQHEYLITAKKP